ncbi:hypothetical protein Taro_050920 [Colocasia esculenta]|uniref:Uncharacterized protein n=1 Tax=Colocasia esculenta TaxID=4460 RepID=A0A843XFK5_COLES|nr:hypothetical protein [Colocasia esculenta]
MYVLHGDSMDIIPYTYCMYICMFSAYFRVLAEGHLGVKPRPFRWCQRPDMDANTNPGVQRYGRQSLWPACAAELQASETRRIVPVVPLLCREDLVKGSFVPLASTPWTPTLIPASSDVDANFSDLHALQSPEFRKQAIATIGELSPTFVKSINKTPRTIMVLRIHLGECTFPQRGRMFPLHQREPGPRKYIKNGKPQTSLNHRTLDGRPSYPVATPLTIRVIPEKAAQVLSI